MTHLKSVLSGIYLLFITLIASAGDSTVLSLAIENARVQPEQAMEKVLNKYPGRLVDFSVDDDHNQLLYEITLIDSAKGEEVEVSVNAADGSMTVTDRDRIKEWDSSTGKFSKQKYQAVFDSNMTMMDAVKKARQMISGTVKEVELESGAGLVYFEVELLTEQGDRKVVVDLKSEKAKLRGRR